MRRVGKVTLRMKNVVADAVWLSVKWEREEEKLEDFSTNDT